MEIIKQAARFRLGVAQTTVLMFSGIILAGTFFLSLPVAHKQPISFIDALFTATSATCVTGLMTINVADTFTVFGQVVIMALINLGAIGIITVSAMFLLMLGKSVSLKNTSVIHDTFSASQKIDVRSLVGSVIIFLFIFEALGTILFTIFWMPKMGFQDAFFHGLFHSVSAFCNAGISTFQNGLDGFEADIPSDIVFVILLIAGGVGFMTIAELYDRGSRIVKSKMVATERRSSDRARTPRRKKWSLQIKLVVITTFFSILLGAVLFFLFELNNAHAGKPLSQQLMSSIFHAASARTAGFVNIDLSHFNNSTLYMFLILMFIGGAPVSTGGGIKVTTFALLIGMAFSRYHGYEHVQMFKQSVPERVMSRVISIVAIAITILTVSMFLLLLTESHSTPVPENSRAEFMPILFEAVSAFGTVGLSMGLTPSLSDPGKIIITLLMLLGRLGPLTIAMAIGTGSQQKEYQHAEETVMVG